MVSLGSLGVAIDRTFNTTFEIEKNKRENISRAELAKRMNVSRARITQIMNLLKLSPDVVEIIKEFGDNFKRPLITERRLRGGGR